jgi:hypothetical protein
VGEGQDLCFNCSSMRCAGMPKALKYGRIAVRRESSEMSPPGVAEVMTPGPERWIFKGDLAKGASRQSGRRKYVIPRVFVAGMEY